MTISFIGTGNMGGALARAAVRAGDPQNVALADYSAEKAKALADELGCRFAADNAAAESAANFFPCCKRNCEILMHCFWNQRRLIRRKTRRRHPSAHGELRFIFATACAKQGCALPFLGWNMKFFVLMNKKHTPNRNCGKLFRISTTKCFTRNISIRLPFFNYL